MPKRRKPPADRPEPRVPMSAAEIATAAFGLAILQAHDDQADPHTMAALLALESLALLLGQDPDRFEPLLRGLSLYAHLRRAEVLDTAYAGQPPPPLGWWFEAAKVH